MKRSTILGIATLLAVGVGINIYNNSVLTRWAREDAAELSALRLRHMEPHAYLSSQTGGVTSFTPGDLFLHCIGGGAILSSFTPPSFFLAAELVQKPKSGAGKPVTTKKAQEDRTAKKSVKKSGAKSPVIAKKKGVRRSGPPLSTRSFDNWTPCILSTYWEWENGTSTASGVPFDDDGLTVAVHNGSRRDLLNHHIEIKYGNKTVRALVTDVFIRWDLKERLDCSPRLKQLLTGERGGLTKGAYFRFAR